MSEETLETVEEVTDEVVEKVVERPDHATEFAELKRQQREIRNSQTQMKDTIAAERAKFMDELRTNPIDFLSQNGISTSQIADQMLGIGTEEVDVPELDPRITKELEELKQWKADQEKAKTQQATDLQVKNYQTQAFSVIEQNSEDFELINSSQDGKKLYWDTIVAYAKEYGEAPNLKDIATKVEASIYNKAKKYLATSKFKPKQTEPSVPSQSSTTLSNSLSGSSSPQVRRVAGNEAVSTSSSYHDFMEKQRAKTMAKYFGDK